MTQTRKRHKGCKECRFYQEVATSTGYPGRYCHAPSWRTGQPYYRGLSGWSKYLCKQFEKAGKEASDEQV